MHDTKMKLFATNYIKMYLYTCDLFVTILFISFVQGYQPPKKTIIPCDRDVECEKQIPYSFCADNTAHSSGLCSCRNDFVLSQQENNTDCLEEAKLFNDPCLIDDQCKPKFGEEAGCINQKCRCKPAAHFVNLLCWKSSKLGEACGNPNNCIATNHSECNGICRCLSGYIGNLQNNKCIKIAQNLGEPCEDSLQCTPVHSFAACEYNVCLCQPGFNRQGNTCVKQVAPQPLPQPPPRHNNGDNRHESVTTFLIPLTFFYFYL